MNLMAAYTTDTLMTRDQIADLPMPLVKGNRHNPVPFAEFIDCVEEQLDRSGLKILNQEHLIGHDNDRYFGLMEVGAIEGELITSDEWSMLVGLRGSHDQSIPRSICTGRQVLVCSNLCFHGDISTMSTKQTTNIWERLPAIVHDAIQKIPELAQREQLRIDKMHDCKIPQRLGDSCLVELMRRGAITTGQIGRAADEWLEPKYQEHAEHGFTAYRLEQAVTEAIKPTGTQSNMFTISHRTEIASEFFDAFIGF